MIAGDQVIVSSGYDSFVQRAGNVLLVYQLRASKAHHDSVARHDGHVGQARRPWSPSWSATLIDATLIPR